MLGVAPVSCFRSAEIKQLQNLLLHLQETGDRKNVRLILSPCTPLMPTSPHASYVGGCCWKDTLPECLIHTINTGGGPRRHAESWGGRCTRQAFLVGAARGLLLRGR